MNKEANIAAKGSCNNKFSLDTVLQQFCQALSNYDL